VKPLQHQEFDLKPFTQSELQHIRSCANEILKRGSTCAPSIWTKKRFKKTV
jgi:hypothetical protein